MHGHLLSGSFVSLLYATSLQFVASSVCGRAAHIRQEVPWPSPFICNREGTFLCNQLFISAGGKEHVSFWSEKYLSCIGIYFAFIQDVYRTF